MKAPEQAVVRGNRLARIVLIVGLFAMVGDATGLDWLKGLGVSTGFAPLPKVFSDVDGHETFAARFTLIEIGQAGAERRHPITPEVYSQLAGPYNRRNVYGAALSYAPRLPEHIWQPVFCYGLEEGGPLRSELGLSVRGPVAVEIETLTRGRSDRFLLEPPCTG